MVDQKIKKQFFETNKIFVKQFKISVQSTKSPKHTRHNSITNDPPQKFQAYLSLPQLQQ